MAQEWWVDVQTHCQLPLYRKISEVVRLNRHLIDPPESSDMLSQVYAANGLDLMGQHVGNYGNVLNEYCAVSLSICVSHI
jgi:hypothetical protein